MANRLGRAPSRGSRGSCAATRPRLRVTVGSMRTGARPDVAPVAIGDASRPTTNCASWSWSCWPSGGARSRSAVTWGRGFPSGRACGCATKASSGPSISWDRDCCGPRGWRRTIAHRCAPGEITGALSSAPSGAGRGLNIRCSRSTSGPSRPRTAPSRGTGNLNAVVKRWRELVLGRRCGRGAWPR
jgi:hypothetical protein